MNAGWSVFKPIREQQLFPHVPGGWIFTIGRRWSYLVNAEQRAQLLARITRINEWRSLWFAVALAGLAAAVFTADQLSGRGFGGWLQFFAIIGIFCEIASVCYSAAMPYIQWRILRSILLGASPAASPPAPAPIDFWESALAPVQDLPRNYSTKVLVVGSAFFAWCTVTWGYDALTSHESYFMPILAASLTVQFGGALLLKLKAKRVPAA